MLGRRAGIGAVTGLRHPIVAADQRMAVGSRGSLVGIA